jgi:hypothetical protein
MQTTQALVEQLLMEMGMSVDALVAGTESSQDWSRWRSLVIELQTNLEGQLSKCEGKFTSDINSVGTYATYQEVADSLQQLKRTLAE